MCYYFLLCAICQGFSIPYQFLETGVSRAARSSGLRWWERASASIPFCDSLQWPYLNVIYSVMPLFLKILNAFWPFEDCYWPGFVFVQLFLLPKAALYKDIQTGVPANKTPLFHSRLGSPASLFSLTPVSRSWSTKTVKQIYANIVYKSKPYIWHWLFIIILSSYPVFPKYYLHFNALKISQRWWLQPWN